MLQRPNLAFSTYSRCHLHTPHTCEGSILTSGVPGSRVMKVGEGASDEDSGPPEQEDYHKGFLLFKLTIILFYISY